MDRLTELFANKPTSYTGLGLSYVGDTRGNAVVSGEQGLEVIPRIRADEGGGFIPPFTVGGGGRVKPGLVDYVAPTIGGKSILDDPPPTLDIPTTGTRHVVLTLNYTLTKTAGVFVAGATLNSASIALTSTQPDNNDLLNTTGTYKILLATFTDGRKTAQFAAGWLQGQVVDDGSGAGRGRIYLLNSYPFG